MCGTLQACTTRLLQKRLGLQQYLMSSSLRCYCDCLLQTLPFLRTKLKASQKRPSKEGLLTCNCSRSSLAARYELSLSGNGL